MAVGDGEVELSLVVRVQERDAESEAIAGRDRQAELNGVVDEERRRRDCGRASLIRCRNW